MQSGLVLRPGGRVWSATLRKKKNYTTSQTLSSSPSGPEVGGTWQ